MLFFGLFILNFINVEIVGAATCDLCVDVSMGLKIISSMTPADIFKNMLPGICGQLDPDRRQICEKFEADFDNFISKINLPNGEKLVCQDAGYCPQKKMNRHLMNVQKVQAATCDLCVDVSMGLKIISSMTPAEIFKTMLPGICGKLDPDRRLICEKFEADFDNFISKINLPNGERLVCQDAGYCPQKKNMMKKNRKISIVDRRTKIIKISIDYSLIL